jgi:hypothetical protein
MINGTHFLLYSKDSEADRTFLRDGLGFPSVDAGRGWLRFALVALVGVLTCGLAPGAVLEAQTTSVVVAGVADAETRAPLTDALVRLPDLGRAARTDWIGEARIAGIKPGPVRIEVRKLGYAPSDITLMVKGDSIGPVFMLSPATTLDTVTVFGRVVPVRLQEFETRRHMGIGRFLTDSVLEKEGDQSLAVALSMKFPGIRAVPDSPIATHYKLVSMRPSTTVSRGNGLCAVDVYLDGFLYQDDIDAVSPREIAGIEFYAMGSAPAQYRRGTGSCQVMLIWSKY